MGNRKRALAGIMAIAVLAAVGGWYVGQQVKNPAEIALETEPPPRSLITVPVEARELSDDVVTRVSVLFDNTERIQVASNPTINAPLVTGRVPERGTELRNGSVLLEVSERPFFILAGELPTSRTIRAGTEGPDVLQLELALRDLGFLEGDADAKFDSATEAAIETLYESEGYTPPVPSESERNELTAARKTVTDAEDSVDSARENLTEAAVTETESERLSRILQWDTTQQRWAEQQQAAREWQDNDSEIRSVKNAEKAAEEAYVEALDRLREAETELKHPDTGEIPTVDEIADLRKMSDDLGKSLVKARALTAKTIAESDAEAKALVQLEQDRRQFEIDTASYRERLARLAPDTKDEAQTVTLREEALVTAREDLAELEARYGPHLPEYEFAFMGNLPRQISRVAAERGDFVGSNYEAVEVAGDTLLVEGAVGENNRPELSEGQEVFIDDPGLDIEIRGTFSRLDDVTDGSSKYPGRYYFQVALEGEFDAEQLVNVGNFRMVIPIGRSSGEVLAVPRNALRTDFDGTVRVQVERSPDVTEFVEVTLGLQPELGGYVEVTPVVPGSLALGDQVVIDEASLASNLEDEASEVINDTEATPAEDDAGE